MNQSFSFKSTDTDRSRNLWAACRYAAA